MSSAVNEIILPVLPDLDTGDALRMLYVLLPVLKEQEKALEERQKVQENTLLHNGHHFGAKNFEGKDILKNAIRIRLADYSAGVSIKLTIPVVEGWFIVEYLLECLKKENDLYIKTGSIILTRVEDICRISYGTHILDVPPDERIKIATAIDKKLYYRNDELGILVRSDGNVYLLIKGERIYVKEPLKLWLFMRVCHENLQKRC